jgi:SAM-dependent methyltransferase
MAIACIPSANLSAEARKRLGDRMEDFYKAPPAAYYTLADKASGQYEPVGLPFHCDLLGEVKGGTRVGEFGCGTAHLCEEVEKRGGIYTGFDWSSELLAANRLRFPRATFQSVNTPVGEAFDLVASLYTIEHVVDPAAYLAQLWANCLAGGLIGVICPEFVDNASLAPSFYYGNTARRLRDKCLTGSFRDVANHLLDLKWRGPAWKRKALTADPGAFWINLLPKALCDPDFTIDADAVHLVRLADLVWWFQQRGGEIVRTSRDVRNASPDVLKFNGYVLVRKPCEPRRDVAEPNLPTVP